MTVDEFFLQGTVGSFDVAIYFWTSWISEMMVYLFTLEILTTQSLTWFCLYIV